MNTNNKSRHCGHCCGSNSRMQFITQNNPNRNKTTVQKKNKGFIGRFLERLAEANEREFGASGPHCH